MGGFEYPEGPHVRKHGPEGYSTYESYRDWLRDEFTFRCVYCLRREQWDGRSTIFTIDHLVPVKDAPERECDYTNLVYACSSCNNDKRAVGSCPDPCEISFSECLYVEDDGTVTTLNVEGEILDDIFQFNVGPNLEWRQTMMRVLELAFESDPELYEKLMGYPEDLPDLQGRRPPDGNTKPDGAKNCYFALRERDELEETY